MRGGRPLSRYPRSVRSERHRSSRFAGHQHASRRPAKIRELLAGIGGVRRDLLSRAAPYWNRRVHRPAPRGLSRRRDGFQIYRYKDALRLLNETRTKFADPAFYAYQEGAIYEGQHEYAAGVREYIKGALAAPDSVDAKRSSLANRPGTRSIPLAEGRACRRSLRLARGSRLRCASRCTECPKTDRRSAVFPDRYDTQNVSPETLSWIEELAAAHHFAAVQELTLSARFKSPVILWTELQLALALHGLRGADRRSNCSRRRCSLCRSAAILGVVRAAANSSGAITCPRKPSAP